MSDKPAEGLGTLLRQLGHALDKRYAENREAYERGNYDDYEPVRYTERRPNWCAICAKGDLMPEHIPQAEPGSGLCARHQRKEREMREKLRAKAAAPQTITTKDYSNTRKR